MLGDCCHWWWPHCANRILSGPQEWQTSGGEQWKTHLSI